MEIRQLTSFVAVADTGSMTKAAQRCHITQSAVSQHIKSLEDETKVILFDRNKKAIKLTDAGKLLLHRARNIVREERETKEELAGSIGNLCGELRIGVGCFIAPYIRRAAIVMMKRYPNVRIHVHFEQSNVLNRMLRDGDIDLAFTMNEAYPYEGIESMVAIPFHLSAIMPKTHWLAEKEVIPFDDLMKCRVIMPDVGERVFGTIQRYTSHDISRLDVAAIVNEASEALMALEPTGYVTFLPSEYANGSTKLVAKPIAGLMMELTSNAHWMREATLKASAKAFLDIVRGLNQKET